MSASPTVVSKTVRAADLQLHYLEVGGELEGAPAVLVLHGWPTSSFLWRNVMVPMGAAGLRVIALDLPGFGGSDKPPDASYSFKFHRRVLDAFCEELGLHEVGLAVHDLGGPVGLYWALQQPTRISKLALLNTLVYPQLSWAVYAFGAACTLPGLRRYISSAHGLKLAMRIGIHDRSKITPELLEGVQAPFRSWAARRALLKAGLGLHPDGLKQIGERIPTYPGPVRIIYGENDRILPDVAKTMARVKRDLPQAEVTALPGCGHFLQEDRPEEIGQLLAEFFATSPE